MSTNSPQLAEYKKTIDRVMAATTHDSSDEMIRNKIATSMARAISMSKVAGDGSIRQPSQTILYRFANIIIDCKTYEQLDQRCKVAFKNRYDCTANKLIEKFHMYNWDINFDVPETAKETKAREKRESLVLIEAEEKRQLEEGQLEPKIIAENTEVMPETTPAKAKSKDVQTFEVIIEALVKDVEKKFEKRIEELKEIIRYHQHRDDKVVMVKEI